MEVTCASCGTANSEVAKFCLECGSPLAAAAPRQVREERKVVSVLFADLVGFTSQAERMDPEEVRALLQPYHASVRADLERWSGTVEKFIGDAVMALFGAPVAREDDPERAVRAALAIRDSLAADGRLHVRIGITTGEALIALEARPQSGEGMASGDVVNTAARLQTAAPVDGILVDEATWRATSRAIEYRDHAPVVAKGKSEAVIVHEAVAARSSFGVDVRGSDRAPLVGRAYEIGLLSGAFARARGAREPQLVTVVGVPGIGKSRIVWELFREIDTGHELVRWRQGRALPYAAGISFWALGEIVKAEAGILDTDSADQAAAKLSRAVNDLFESAESAESVESATDASWVERHLRPLVGLEAGVELRGDHRGEAFTAWTRYLEALAEQRPLVLVFEDLQWADDGLLDFIDHLVDWASGVPMLIVGTARPELFTRRSEWGGGKPNALTISLSPLSDAETGSLVAALVEQAVIPDSARAAVLERAQGNPLYAEEFARLVSERGRLDSLPESVQGIVAARLDTLPREEKELLQDAAVVGKVFWSGVLASMRGRELAIVSEQLHGLERKEFVRRERRSSVAGETEYAFRHILVRDVAYGQIPRVERSERHAAAAHWIEALGRPADHAELLANHYMAAIELARTAGRPTEAFAEPAHAAFREAGDRASALNAFAGAARYYRAALELVQPDDAERASLLFRYGKALRISDESGADVLAEAETGLRAAGDLATAAEAAVLQAELAWFAGDGEGSAAHLARAADLVKDLPPSFSKAYVLSDLSRYHMLGGRNDQAIAVGRQALEIAEAFGFDEIRAHALNNVGSARSSLGDAAGIADLEEALKIAEAANSLEVPRAMNNLAAQVWESGDFKRAASLFREGLIRARELGNVAVARFMEASVPNVDYFEGAWDDALDGLEKIISEAEAGHASVNESFCRVDRARIRFARGDGEGAFDDVQQAVALGRRSGVPVDVVRALAVNAWLLIQTGDARGADALVSEAEVLRAEGNAIESSPAELVLSLLALHRIADVERLATTVRPGAWRDAALHAAAGRLGEAGDRHEEMGERSPAALYRFAGAEALAHEGHAADARIQLDKAVAFWQSVGAAHFIAQARALEDELEAAPTQPERTAAH